MAHHHAQGVFRWQPRVLVCASRWFVRHCVGAIVVVQETGFIGSCFDVEGIGGLRVALFVKHVF